MKTGPMAAIAFTAMSMTCAMIVLAQSSHDPYPDTTHRNRNEPLPALDPHPVVALTFDDLPAAGKLPPGMSRVEQTTRLVSELKVNRLEGTYGFVNGVKMQTNLDADPALHIWLDSGMNIGTGSATVQKTASKCYLQADVG